MLIPQDKQPVRVQKLSTADIEPQWRADWLHDVIGREYANVSITPPRDEALFNEMRISPWGELQLSHIHSSSIQIERRPNAIPAMGQDAYFIVVMLAGRYMLEQQGREVFLQAGDISVYDATRPHHIYCPNGFEKLIISIPRPLLKSRVGAMHQRTALHISGQHGLGHLTSHFLSQVAHQIPYLSQTDFDNLSHHALDLISRAIHTGTDKDELLPRSKADSLATIKSFIELHLSKPDISSEWIARRVGFSTRYVNLLFNDHETSLMRYVWKRRLERCAADLRDPGLNAMKISEIAFRWGFNDLSHFSRSFSKQYEQAPREYRGQIA